MTIFISYSHQDSDFVDSLAAKLIQARHNIWLDRWELSIGDSITSKIEENIGGSDAILVMLSEHSVASNWCRRELNAGLVRELEEKRVLVMPCIIGNCEIPLFLKDKYHANFHRNFDEAFHILLKGLCSISNPASGRHESNGSFTDFGLVWRDSDTDDINEESWIIRWTFVDHSQSLPYVVISECKVYVEADRRPFSMPRAEAEAYQIIRDILGKLVADANVRPITEIISDQQERYVIWRLSTPSIGPIIVVFTYKRLGTDTGMDTVVHLDNNLRMALRHMSAALGPDKS